MRSWIPIKALAVMLLFPVFVFGQGVAPPNADPDSSHDWVDRPWNIRYFLSIRPESDLRIAVKIARAEENPSNEKRGAIYRRYETIFGATSNIPMKGEDEGLMAIAITFDRSGQVLSPHEGMQPLIGKRNRLREIVLASPGTDNPLLYDLGYWFMGLPGDQLLFSPALCSLSDDHRYQKHFSRDFVSRYSSDGNFGCREWTYQLYDHDRPYIDMTSYQKDGAYIKELIGWSRFEDPPKPVIGKHDKTWYCLYECPNGEAAGVIPDIAAWSKRHGFPLPKRPRKQPMFPHADFSQYVND
ncbi:MAG TPA: hypothetical protein VJ698_09095 [Noviherbaspirillum sp.]|uniref:hypothetical protein n=1 Tax=Noviherbaspirillum sp. TaxID=1926288 RepID=UPI002B47A7EB|nr:hypothetical protein [Noviherbaspirillum sp.]HJV85621.1 hypothetical protein [Noviherbaspirillum sp.]